MSTILTQPLVSSFPAPAKDAICLPEGKRIVSVSVDFTQLPIRPLPLFTFPELAITPESATSLVVAYKGYSIFTVNLSSLQLQGGLAEVRGLLYDWRPTYCKQPTATAPGDFAQAGDTPIGLSIFNTGNGFVQRIPNWNTLLETGATAVIVSGALPFFGKDNLQVRFLLPQQFTFPQGKGMFWFTNFDVQPFTNFINYATSD